MHGYLSADVICSEERTCELQGTDYVQGQISEHNSAINVFRIRAFLKIRGLSLGCSPVLASEYIQLRNAFRPIACERKKKLKDNRHNNAQLQRKYARKFVLGH